MDNICNTSFHKLAEGFGSFFAEQIRGHPCRGAVGLCQSWHGV